MDCILVLGASTDEKIFSVRVDKAIELYQHGFAPFIVFSGKHWALRKVIPEKSEARLMMEYALKSGVPAKSILTEEHSTDTIGNIFFTKWDILEHKGWKKFIIISTDYHETRLRYIMDKILGPKYLFEFVGVPPKNIPEKQLIKNKEAEISALNKLKEFFSTNPDINTQNTKELEGFLFRFHPYYK